jgi:ClpP class serine protease
MAAKGPATDAPKIPGKAVQEDPGVSGEASAPSQQEQQMPLDELFALDRSDAKDEQIRDIVNRHIVQVAGQTFLPTRYNVLFLYDGASVGRADANRIYRALGTADPGKSNLLILRSPGGDVSAAYFIGKLCREYTKATFEVAVPREAKSAENLI